MKQVLYYLSLRLSPKKIRDIDISKDVLLLEQIRLDF
jgi:hypothetical protein